MANMNGDTELYPIGELAHRSGLSVRTIRFYSDAGLVPPDDRTPAGYRLYGVGALARLGVVRVLRELGIGLDTIRQVLDARVTLADIAEAHVQALDAQLRTLRFRRAVLRAVAGRESTPEEVMFMHDLAHASTEERNRIMDEFFDEVFAELDYDHNVAQKYRSVRPELPDDPTPQQVEAWVELADLVRDPDYRRHSRHQAQQAVDSGADHPTSDPGAHERAAAVVAERAGAALDAGIDPGAEAATPILDAVVAAYAAIGGDTDDARYRSRLLRQLEANTDARNERYWTLLFTVNGWEPFTPMVPPFEWVIAALRARQ